VIKRYSVRATVTRHAVKDTLTAWRIPEASRQEPPSGARLLDLPWLVAVPPNTRSRGLTCCFGCKPNTLMVRAEPARMPEATDWLLEELSACPAGEKILPESCAARILDHVV
jgi:hypothetical protein